MAKPKQPPTAEPLNGLRILVVEDNSSTAADIKLYFQSAGTKVKITYDGEQALRLLDKDPNFNLIITDQSMPGMGGVQLILKIIQNPGITSCKKFILHTSHEEDIMIEPINQLNQMAEQMNTGIHVSYLQKGQQDKYFLSAVAARI